MKSKIAVTLCLVFAIAILGNIAVFAASETEAVAYLVERGIYEGDENGNLNLDKTFTRAELAVILTRLDFIDAPGGLDEWRDWGMEHFALPENRYNKFTDLPKWALPYIEYCYEVSMVKGVTPTLFDPSGTVNPKMICTVILRWLRLPETDWDYGTAVEKARSLGLAPGAGLDGETVSRGAVADMIYAALLFDEADAGTQLPESAPDAPQTSPGAPVLPESSPTVASMTIDEMKDEIVRLTNEERVKAGLNPVEVLPELMDCAQAKAQDFLDNNYFSHTSKKYGSADEMIFAWIPNAGTAAENIAGWSKTPAEAFQSWMNSTAGHKETMLTARLTHIGVGVVEGVDGGYWWVQQFCRIVI
jgi:uncharacterized protein YkwD